MYKNILIIKLSAIGDVIHALPVAHALKECFPQARITWVVEKAAYNLLTHHPDIDEIILFDKPQFKSMSGLLKNGSSLAHELRTHKFDLALDLQGLFKSAAVSLLSGAKKKLVYCDAREGSDIIGDLVRGQYSKGHVIDRYLDVVRSLDCKVGKPKFNITITPDEIASAETIVQRAGFQTARTYVVLAPGTNWPNKCWPMEYYAELVDRLYGEHIIPVIVGGISDTFLYEQIAAATHIPPIDLTNKTSLKELAYVIKQADVFVGGDTGPMHLAAAVDTPVVAMFGPTDPERNGPYGEEHEVLTIPESCTGCWKRQCKLKKDCLSSISVDRVYAAVKAQLGKRQGLDDHFRHNIDQK